jgi:hypothetical protein
MDTAIACVMLLIAIIIGIFLIRIPIIIAKNRNLAPSDITYIAILSWVGIFFGITWLVALVWAILGNKLEPIPELRASDSLEALKKLSELKNQGLLSESEFAEKRKKLLERI